jgi:putative oxidoreductase
VPFPRVNVYISGYTELIGGWLWMLGFGTRVISIPLFFNFCVAYLTASRDEVINVFHNPGDFANDNSFPFWAASLVFLAFGPGWISIDGVIRYLIGRSRSPLDVRGFPIQPPTPKS